ncbi:transcription initiation factor TFIID subunit 4-like isoform X2 [Scophthalmus maximus]|uniref:Transcription initiation factor TFIID component TAF4 C-terminal domain-containing protein n=1 Tax=Scophthalmus maximus TaxID=52904 RepID=A0A8D3E1C9_SCOMX|nr:transcription initiation factor TFIID subunit 4-like isoform X2 [Scophthalmus maximus]
MATFKLESCGAAGEGNASIKVHTLHVPAQGGPIAAVQHPPTAASVSSSVSACGPSKVIATGQGRQPTSSTLVVAKVATPGGMSANGQRQVTKPALSQVAYMNQATTTGRTVVITVPRTAAPQPVAVAPQVPQTASSHLPANIQIPSGMVLIRSDSGQLMLISQQALAKAQQAPRVASGQAPRILSHQVSAASESKSNEKVTVIRMAAPPSFVSTPIQKTAVVKVFGVAPKPAVGQTQNTASAQKGQSRNQAADTQTQKTPLTTFSQETLESVRKCKNFLVTLIKLASSDTRTANMANNVRGLVRILLKSLPAVRCLTADPQLFILQASTFACNPNTLSPTMKQSIIDTGQNLNTNKQVIQPTQRVILRPGLTTLAQSRNYMSKSSRPNLEHTVLQSGKHLTETFSKKQSVTQFKDSGSYKDDDDDINDVAFMAGVNVREENAQILTTVVGSVVQSCQDQAFLSSNPLLSRILHTGQALGVNEVSPEVVALVSHATQECLRGLLERLIVIAEHRKAALKDNLWCSKVSDVRSQLHFLEEVEALNKKRKDEEEREKLLCLARGRSHNEDPQFQQLKQRVKELQQRENAQLQQREANQTALAAIGPRRKRPVEQTEYQDKVETRILHDCKKAAECCEANHQGTRDCVSDTVVCSTGAPQGTVLAPFLLTLYTADFMYSTATRHLQKFSDDSAIVGFITDDDDREFRELTQDFVDWCQWNCLQINAGKTKELVVDFHKRSQPPTTPVNIQGKDIERVDWVFT